MEWRDKACVFAAGGSAVIGATELQRLLVLTDQLPKLSGDLLAKAESKVEALRSELKTIIESAEDAFLVIELAELLVEGRLVDEAWGATTLETLRERMLGDEGAGTGPSGDGGCCSSRWQCDLEACARDRGLSEARATRSVPLWGERREGWRGDWPGTRNEARLATRRERIAKISSRAFGAQLV